MSAHEAAVCLAASLTDPMRSGVKAALALVPTHRVPRVLLDSDSPWIIVEQPPGLPLVVWRYTGAVFTCEEDGSVGEEPVVGGIHHDGFII